MPEVGRNIALRVSPAARYSVVTVSSFPVHLTSFSPQFSSSVKGVVYFEQRVRHLLLLAFRHDLTNEADWARKSCICLVLFIHLWLELFNCANDNRS